MLKIIKLILLILVLLICFSSSKADTKVLRNISVALKNFLHNEDISLDNEGYIKSEGLIVQKFLIPHDSGHVFKVTVMYIADKDGYQPKVIWMKEEYTDVLRLSPSTLKSVTG